MSGSIRKLREKRWSSSGRNEHFSSEVDATLYDIFGPVGQFTRVRFEMLFRHIHFVALRFKLRLFFKRFI